MSKQSIEVEGLMKLVEWAEAEADGTSIDLKDPRLQKLRDLEPVLIAAGVVQPGWADSVLPAQDAPVVPSIPTGSARVYRIGENFVTCAEGEQGRGEGFPIFGIRRALRARGVEEGGVVRVGQVCGVQAGEFPGAAFADGGG